MSVSLLPQGQFAPATSADRWINGHLATSLVATCYVLICIPMAYSLNIWIDEGYTLHATGGSLEYALHEALAFEDQPPLYYVLLKLWRQLDGSDFVARLFSTVSVVAALYVVADFVRRRFPAIPTVVAVALVAFNPFAVWAGTEARVYAFALLLSTLLIARFFETFVNDGPRRSSLGFIVVATAALYTQYYLASLILAGGIALIVLRRWTDLRRFVVALAFIALAFAPMPPIVYAQIHASHDGVSFGLPFLSAIRVVLAIFLNFALPHAWIRQTGHIGLFNVLFYAATFAAVGTAIVRSRFNADATTRTIVIFIATTAAFFLFLNVVLRQQLLPRYFVAAFMPTMLAVIALCNVLARDSRIKTLLFLLTIVLALDCTSVLRFYPDRAKPGDWLRVTAFLSGHARPSEPIAFFHQEEAFMFQHYFRGDNRLVPIPRPLDFEHYRTAAFGLHSEGDVARALHGIASAPTMWLVRVSPCRFEFWDLGCQYLNGYIARHFRTIETNRFSGSDVLHLERIAK